MTENLRIDTVEVQQVSTNLQRIVSALEDAADDSNRLADVIPVRELSSAVDDFAGKWDDRRRSLIEQVTALKEQAQAVASAFDDVDSQLVDALTRPPQPESTGAGPHGTGPQAV
jgi:hypothetical protein